VSNKEDRAHNGKDQASRGLDSKRHTGEGSRQVSMKPQPLEGPPRDRGAGQGDDRRRIDTRLIDVKGTKDAESAKAIIRLLVASCHDHKKVILYANQGTEALYSELGFLRMNTALAI
jgi:hypothetical protein